MILVNSGAFLSISSWFCELTELIFVMIPYISSTGYPLKTQGIMGHVQVANIPIENLTGPRVLPELKTSAIQNMAICCCTQNNFMPEPYQLGQEKIGGLIFSWLGTYYEHNTGFLQAPPADITAICKQIAFKPTCLNVAAIAMLSRVVTLLLFLIVFVQTKLSLACTKTRNTGTPEHRNTGTPEHLGTPEHRNTGTPRNTGIPRNTGTPEYPGTPNLPVLFSYYKHVKIKMSM